MTVRQPRYRRYGLAVDIGTTTVAMKLFDRQRELGDHSGRDEPDKVAKTSLTPVFDGDYTYFAQAKLVLVCRKLYHAPIRPEGFVDQQIIADCYPNRDFHEMYVGEIVKVLAAD